MYVGPAPMKPYNGGRWAWPDWYLTWDYCAGFIVNWGVHHLDIANWGCPAVGDESAEITCTGSYRDDGLTDNFLDCVRSRRDPISPVEAGHKASYLGLLPEIACRLGRKLKWNPATEEFLDDREANQMLTRPMRGPWHL